MTTEHVSVPRELFDMAREQIERQRLAALEYGLIAVAEAHSYALHKIDAIDAHLAKGAQEWQPIETAPTGAKGYAWMLLAWGPDEDKSVSNGMRCGDRFFAAPSFYCMGQERQFQQREIEVFPTHWMPLPDAPMLSQRGEVES